MTTQSDLRTISSLLGDALSQFSKLFQNEVDLAKAEFGEKVRQATGAMGFIAAGAVLVIPAIVMALFALSAALIARRVVAADLLSCLGGPCRGDCRRAVCGRPQPAGYAQTGAPRNDAPARKGQGYREGNGAMSGIQTSFLDNLREAVRENPLSVALIGGGALWLLMGNERLKSAAASVSAATAPLADIGAHNQRSGAPKFTNSPPTAPEMNDGASQHLHETFREATNAASNAVSDTAATIKDRFKEGVTYASEKLESSVRHCLGKKPSRRSNRRFPIYSRGNRWCSAPSVWRSALRSQAHSVRRISKVN